MGSLLRSEEMSLIQMFLQADSAYCCVAELGELGLVQFIDLNEDVSAYQRKFKNELRRCDNMERILNYIENELKKYDVEILEIPGHIPAPDPKDAIELEATLHRLEEELLEINTNTVQLQVEFTEMVEMRETIDYVQAVLDEGQQEEARAQLTDAQQGFAGPIAVDGEIYEKIRAATISTLDLDVKDLKDYNELSFIAGTLDRRNAVSFERVLWRWCLGNVFVRNRDLPKLDYDFLDESTDKIVFIIFFFGEELRTRVKKICNSFHAMIYNCPVTAYERQEMRQNMSTRIDDMKAVLEKTVQHREKVLRATAQNHNSWYTKVLKMKAIYETLNRFNVDVTQRCLIAECWAPTRDLDLIKQSLIRGMESSGSTILPVMNEMEPTEQPPTYNKVNKFTSAFQNIVDAYGAADYREINPAPWTIITFPFIFAVMFGDAGHGLIMFLSALSLIIFERRLIDAKIKDEIFNIFFGGRYVILLMGLFSIYTGLVYNEVYSRSIHIFDSSWKNPYSNEELEGKSDDYEFTLPPGYAFEHEKGPYPFGLDPVWNTAENKLTFENPLKMKMSVIIGILQMAFGLALSIFNHIYFKSLVDIIFVWIPQLLFLACIFIYLCIVIIIKWIKFYVWPQWVFGFFYPSSNCAPSLLLGLIDMFMVKRRDPGFVNVTSSAECEQALQATRSISCGGPVIVEECQRAVNACTTFDSCGLQQWYPNQSKVELILLIVAVVSIPVMLLVKPFILLYRSRRGGPVSFGHGASGNAKFNFGDIMVLQAIHTIEFCLGCISHTASYLRLWALSLAHAELSEVLWTMVFRYGFVVNGWAGLVAQYILFWAFALLTIAILILMEGLSAFLHALRLHWVEFQSKFYSGTGYLFEPFSFERIMNQEL